MNEPTLILKETKWGYITAIFCAGLLFAGMTAVGILMVNAQLLEPDIDIELQHNLYTFGVIFILLFALIYSGLIIYWILSMTKKRVEFYDDRIVIMFGTKQMYSFYYTNIENYYITKILSNCCMIVTKFNQYRHDEVLRRRVFDFSLTHDNLQRVNEMLREKIPQKAA